MTDTLNGAITPLASVFYVSKTTSFARVTIPPGGWGKAYDRYWAGRQEYGDPWQLIIELALENERLRVAPHLPSRFESNFAFPDRASAEQLGSRLGASEGMVMWQATFTDASATIHRGRFDLFDRLTTHISYADVRNIAQTYWRSIATGGPEELVARSPLRLNRAVAFYCSHRGWVPLDTPGAGAW